jgi:hypothetical protein
MGLCPVSCFISSTTAGRTGRKPQSCWSPARQVADILHSVPNEATYEVVAEETEAINWPRRGLSGQRNLPPPSTTWWATPVGHPEGDSLSIFRQDTRPRSEVLSPHGWRFNAGRGPKPGCEGCSTLVTTVARDREQQGWATRLLAVWGSPPS